MSELFNNFELFVPSLYKPFVANVFEVFIAIAKITIIYTPLFTFFHFFKKTTNSLAFTDAQKNTNKLIDIYSTIVNFPFILCMIVDFIDCITIFFKIGDVSMLAFASLITLYVFLVCKILFMLGMYKKNALVFTRIFLITLPFVTVYVYYYLYPYAGILGKAPNPFGHEPDYLLLFMAISLFSAYYLLFFTFSKRIKAAWADPPPLPKGLRPAPFG